jgi:hypothetical protein
LTELFEFFSVNEGAPVFIFLLPAAVLILLGWLIKYKKVTWLISGYKLPLKRKKSGTMLKSCANIWGILYSF